MSDQTACRQTYTYKLQLTAYQERELERMLLLCRHRDNGALEQRITAYQRCHVCVSRYQQEAELKDLRAAGGVPRGRYAAIHRHVVHDVLARLDQTDRAYFRRV